MKWVSFQCPLLQPLSSNLGLSIVDALKQTKTGQLSNSSLTLIDSNVIEVHDVKYLQSSFGDDIVFVLPLLLAGSPMHMGEICMEWTRL